MGKPTTGFKSIVAKSLSYGILLFLVLLCAYFQYLTKGSFLSSSNVVNILQQIAINTIIAVGMTFVIVSAGIDLSVGSLVALSGVLSMTVLLHGFHMSHIGTAETVWPLVYAIPIAALAGVAVGGAAGAFSGFFITRLNVTPFIATLAMMGSAKGLALVLTNAQPVSPLPRVFTDMVGGPSIVLHATARLPIMLGILVLGYLFCSRIDVTRRLSAGRLFAALSLTFIVGGLVFHLYGRLSAFTYGTAFFLLVVEYVLFIRTSLGGFLLRGRPLIVLRFLVLAVSYLLLWHLHLRVVEFAIPPLVPLALLVVAVGFIVMTRTDFGRRVYAIGGNEEAARLSGINVKNTKLGVYTICGMLAGLSGFMMAARLAAGDPKSGEMFEMNAIAAVVLGGTSLMGGRGSVTGTLLGALVIGVLAVGLEFIGVSTYYQMVVKGGVILLAVVLDQLKVRLSSQS